MQFLFLANAARNGICNMAAALSGRRMKTITQSAVAGGFAPQLVHELVHQIVYVAGGFAPQ